MRNEAEETLKKGFESGFAKFSAKVSEDGIAVGS